jgi:hypothetical protein
MTSRLLTSNEAPSNSPFPPELLAPKLITGETTQAIMTTTFIPSQTIQQQVTHPLNAAGMKSAL